MTKKRFVPIGVEWTDGFVQDHEDDKDLFSINAVCDLLNELQDKSDKKQVHIVLLEGKIHRMRENIKRLEALYHYRGYIGSGDVKKEYYRREKLLRAENDQLKKENEQLKQSIDDMGGRLQGLWANYYENRWGVWSEAVEDVAKELGFKIYKPYDEPISNSDSKKERVNGVKKLNEVIYENKQLKEQNQRLSEQKNIYKQDWKHLCIDKELLDSENEQLRERIKELEKEVNDLSCGEADWLIEEEL